MNAFPQRNTGLAKTLAEKFHLLSVTVLLSGLLIACGNKPENPAVGSAGATEKDVPMSAKPADVKEKPIAVGEEGKVGEVVATSSKVATDMPISATAATDNIVPVIVDSNTDATAEDGVDNSGMDKISESDQVIDDAPASPDAPKAQEGAEAKSGISNQPTTPKNK